ncbi:MAG: DUF1189 family protein [Dissulfurispiraceae bacterium]|jgi:hypothetical protein|nr:DUF1189 family protein [Dissulfurispiraceae bacterium]
MKEYSSFHPLYMSFYSPDIYRHTARNGKGFGFVYLVILVAVFLIPKVMSFDRMIAEVISTEAPAIANQTPEITITKGKVSIKESQPYVITKSDGKTPLLVIDTSGNTTFSNTEALYIVTESKVLVRPQQGGWQHIDLSSLDGVVINKSSIYEFLDWIEDWIFFLIYPFAFVMALGYRLLQAFLCGVVGVAFARSKGYPFAYSSAVRVASFALTPAVVVGSLLVVLNFTIPYWDVISFGAALGYTVFGVRSSMGADMTA